MVVSAAQVEHLHGAIIGKVRLWRRLPLDGPAAGPPILQPEQPDQGLRVGQFATVSEVFELFDAGAADGSTWRFRLAPPPRDPEGW